MYKYRVSYIVPIYNVEQYLERCIKSLLNQDLSNHEYEIILIDDSSTDSSGEIAKKYSEKYENISLYHQNNAGPSVARNNGMDHIQGKYTIFVDADDFWLPNKLKSIIDFTEENDLDICYFGFNKNNTSGYIKECFQPFKSFQLFTGEEILLQGLHVEVIWDKVYSTDFVSRYRFYPGIIHEDVDFNFKILPFANRIMFVHTIVYNYTWNINSITRIKDRQKSIKSFKDDIIVVKHLNDFITQFKISIPLKSYYIKRANSIMFSVLHRLYKELDRKSINELLDYAKKLKVYPVKGKTESKKSTLLLRIYNFELLYRFLIVTHT